jgi:hypothetical protein
MSYGLSGPPIRDIEMQCTLFKWFILPFSFEVLMGHSKNIL